MEAGDVKPTFQGESASHVLPTGGSAEFCLGRRFSTTIKALHDPQFALSGESAGELARLVETAIPVAPVVQGHRDQGVPRFRPRVVVIGLGQPADEPAVLVILVVVLETEHRLEHLPLRAIGRARPTEMPTLLRASLAHDGRVDALEPGERLAALPAEGRRDGDGGGLRAFLPREGEVQRGFAPVPGVGSGTMEGCR